MPQATLHDGSALEIEVNGNGPAVLLALNARSVDGGLIGGLSDAFRVVAFEYQAHVMANPMPRTLTAENVVADILAIADAAEVDRFAYYGYSWLAMAGLQLAVRTDRLTALIMGAFPPLDGPYKEMLNVFTTGYDLTRGAKVAQEPNPAIAEFSAEQGLQFVTLWNSLQTFDDGAAQSKITCPRLCFVGSNDMFQLGKDFDNTHVSLADLIGRRQKELEGLGWDVRVLDDLDHAQAMRAINTLPVIRSWFHDRFPDVPPAAPAAQYRAITVDPNLLEAYVGRYALTPAVVLTVSCKEGLIFAQVTGQPQFEIFPYSEHDYFFKVVDAQITFVTDGGDHASELILHQGGRDLPAKRIKEA